MKANKPLTVEQMVRKCFAKEGFLIVTSKRDALYFARAARRFVRMEQKQQHDRRMQRINYLNERYKTACRKTGRDKMKDLRSPLAKERDAFLESEDGRKLLAGTTSGQYLENRIVTAWLAGVEYGERSKTGKGNK